MAPLTTWLAHQNPSNRRHLPLSTLGNLNPFPHSAPRSPRRPQSVPGLASAVATTHVTSPPSAPAAIDGLGLSLHARLHQALSLAPLLVRPQADMAPQPSPWTVPKVPAALVPPPFQLALTAPPAPR